MKKSQEVTHSFALMWYAAHGLELVSRRFDGERQADRTEKGQRLSRRDDSVEERLSAAVFV